MTSSTRPLVLLTGATGFIGSALVERLSRTYELVALDRAGPPAPPSPAQAVDFDLSNDDAVRAALATVRERFGAKIASVIHLAAYYDTTGEPNPLYEAINVDGSRRLIDALQAFDVGQFVYASTMLVHRATLRMDERINEDSPLEASWAYPESKIRAEQVLRERQGRIPLVLLRIAGVYDDQAHSPFIAEQISRIYEHRLTSHVYPGMLCAAQSFVHVDDLADAVVRVVDRRGALPVELPLLIGEPDAMGYEEVQDSIGRSLHGDDWTTIRVPGPLAKAGAWIENAIVGNTNFIKPWMVEASSAHYILDITRARQLLDWTPRHSLRDALPRIVEALKRDPVGWYKANKLNAALVAWKAAGRDSHGDTDAAPNGCDAQATPARLDDPHAGHGTPAVLPPAASDSPGAATHPGGASATSMPPAQAHVDHAMPGASGSSPPGTATSSKDAMPIAPSAHAMAGDVPASPAPAHAGGHAGHAMSSAGGHDHMAMMDEDGRRTRWAHYANIGLGLWLAASPWVYGTAAATITPAVRAVTVDRGLAPPEWRAMVLAISDVASGLLIALFAALSLSRRTAWFAQWAVTLIGLWLLAAPLLFWSPSAAQYQNDLLVGALVIAFSVLVPMMPGMSMDGMMDRSAIPPGWSYCPSTGGQRLPIAAMGLIGLLISRMLTAYQLGHIDAAWEPFFAGNPLDPKNGTEEIITSAVSRAWPIPDAGLGAVSYLLEILMAVMGTRDRWRTMPWMVTFFGILVIPLGVVSIYFIIIQPIMIGTWSTPALIAALAMLVMIPFALDEVIAMGQYLRWAHCRGKPLLRIFFQGGAVDDGRPDPSDSLAGPRAFWADARRGITLPWTLAASFAIGVALMLTRLLFGTSGALANSDHIVGALVISLTIIATAEVARVLRFGNALLGAWLLVAPWLLDGGSVGARVASMVFGLALIGLSLPRGRRTDEHYASWDRFVV